MKTKNLTPFLFGTKATFRKAPFVEMTAIVKATFDLRPDGVVTVPEGQPLLVQRPLTAEVFREDDEDLRGECLYPGDFADFKRNAEVLLAGTCHAPNQIPTPQCPVRFGVGSWSKSLRVVGRRVFSGLVPGASTRDPSPFTRMPLTYENAFGGPDYDQNPVGKGYGTNELPHVEGPADVVTSPRDKLPPAGFGPLSPYWPARLAKQRRGLPKDLKGLPFLPDDFDWTYFQAAPADQQIEGYLVGDEELVFQNLHPTHPILKTRLPGLRIRVFVNDVEARFREVPMNLDTLFADLDKETVTLIFRGLTQVREIDLIDIKTALIASEPLSEAPLPREHYKAALDHFEADPYQIDDRVPEPTRPLAREVLHHQRIAPPDTKDPSADPISALLKAKLGNLAPREQERVRKAVEAVLATPAPPGTDLREHIRRAVQEAEKAPPRLAAPAPGVVNLKDAQTQGALQRLRGLVEKLKDDAAKKNVKLKGLEAYEALMADERFGGNKAGAPPPEPGPGIDCSGHDYSGRDLRGRDLRGANFAEAILTRADMEGAQLQGASLKQAVLTEANLADADLSGADLTRVSAGSVRAPRASFRGATLDHAILQKADFKGADFSEAKGEMPQFTSAVLAEAKAPRARFTKAFFRRATLAKADFSHVILIGCYLGECDITEARFEDATLTKTSFAGADATRARFNGARGEDSVWMEASLSHTDFSYASLERGFFVSAKIIRARFFGANMRECRLDRAVMDHAEVESANLAGANLRSSTLTSTSFRDSNLFEASFDLATGAGCDFHGANLKRSSLEKAEGA